MTKSVGLGQRAHGEGLSCAKAIRGGRGVDVRFIRRALLEQGRLPRLVRLFRGCQAVCIAFLVSCMLAMLIFRAPVTVVYVLLVVATIPLLVSVFGVGLLTWKNYEHTAEIWAENVRGRGLDSWGVGWLIDTGTVRAIGAVKALFTAAMVVALTVQTIWPWTLSLLGYASLALGR